eukprot:TRINITY_DN1138_c0_g1_i2.p1 TRINITY_DN1138_c0_g1~~TRINITY_DN1138_c0_g1_i2.p1  ORF type:complete len:215 (+),score=9.88 TRINITY_DN1138_c0_g1_i2:82-645(+)
MQSGWLWPALSVVFVCLICSIVYLGLRLWYMTVCTRAAERVLAVCKEEEILAGSDLDDTNIWIKEEAENYWARKCTEELQHSRYVETASTLEILRSRSLELQIATELLCQSRKMADIRAAVNLLLSWREEYTKQKGLEVALHKYHQAQHDLQDLHKEDKVAEQLKSLSLKIAVAKLRTGKVQSRPCH